MSNQQRVSITLGSRQPPEGTSYSQDRITMQGHSQESTGSPVLGGCGQVRIKGRGSLRGRLWKVLPTGTQGGLFAFLSFLLSQGFRQGLLCP